MLYNSPPKPILIIVITLILTFTYSCRKEVSSLETQNLNTNNIAFLYQAYSSIKIDQAIIIYDSTSIVDSVDYVNPPSNKYYEWKIIPDNGCATISGKAKYGIAQIAFSCSGVYQISGMIYDSATHALVANTDTMQVEVTGDKLFKQQAIDKNDILNVEPTYVMSWQSLHNSNIDPPDDVHIFLRLSTTKSYDYDPEFEYGSASASNNFVFNFSDSLKLQSYPFAFGTGKYVVQETIDLWGSKVGIPAKVSIRWLGKDYSGTVLLSNQYNITYQWDNSGAVKFN